MTRMYSNLDQLPESLYSAAIAVGNFDGVHRGHAKLIQRLVDVARSVNGPVLAMTFDPPPQAILVPQRALPKPLTTLARRAELLASLGVDALVAYPTDAKLLALSPQDFFQQIVVGKLHARAMVEGPNFRFGRDRSGGTDLLAELCREHDMQFEIAEATSDADGMLSSTRIRGLLNAGNIEQANRMLTSDYELQGVVSHGAQRGHGLGFPTANLTEIETFIPAAGVYAGSVVLDGSTLPAAVNVGPNPTFDESHSKVEVHIIGWNAPLYGTKLACQLHRRIRDVEKFDTVEALRAQIELDIIACLNS